MSLPQSLLIARIELGKRHLQEWNLLSTAQKEVWRLISQETDRKLSINSGDRSMCLDLKHKRFIELTQTMADQREEREQMKTRQQQQIAALK